jgi:hypothetical protein
LTLSDIDSSPVLSLALPAVRRCTWGRASL